MTSCFFCQGQLGKAGKSREHVIPVWLQADLGIKYLPISLIRQRPSSGEILASRPKHPLEQLQLKKVCKSCNTGWMSRLENEFRSIFFGLDDLTLSLDGPSPEQRLCIVRWSVKTAAMFQTASNLRKMMPHEHGASARFSDRFPEGLHVYAGMSQIRHFDFFAASSWMAAVEDSERVAQWLPSAYKYGFHIGHLLLVVCYWPLESELMVSHFTRTHHRLLPAVNSLAIWESTDDTHLRATIREFATSIGIATNDSSISVDGPTIGVKYVS